MIPLKLYVGDRSYRGDHPNLGELIEEELAYEAWGCGPSVTPPWPGTGWVYTYTSGGVWRLRGSWN